MKMMILPCHVNVGSINSEREENISYLNSIFTTNPGKYNERSPICTEQLLGIIQTTLLFIILT